MTLADIQKAVAAYLNKVPSNLTVNQLDLFLTAVNQVRMNAELTTDFEFTRRLMSLSVDGVTGGNLSTAVEYGTAVVYDIKTMLDVGQFDINGNFIPVDWTTTEPSLNFQRGDNPMTIIRYPTDAQAVSSPLGWRRIVFSGNKVYTFPKATNTTLAMGFEAYTFTNDWVDYSAETDAVRNIWLTKGAQYLQWQTIIQINQLYKGFVFRQEGNLPPPQDLAAAGLQALQTWDAFRYNAFRRRR